MEKKPRALLIALDCSSATFWAETTSTPVGRILAMSRSTVALSAPADVATSMVSTRPSSWKSFWAVGRVKAAKVAPPRLSAEPKRTIPEMVKVSGGPGSSTLT